MKRSNTHAHLNVKKYQQHQKCLWKHAVQLKDSISRKDEMYLYLPISTSHALVKARRIEGAVSSFFKAARCSLSSLSPIGNFYSRLLANSLQTPSDNRQHLLSRSSKIAFASGEEQGVYRSRCLSPSAGFSGGYPEYGVHLAGVRLRKRGVSNDIPY